MFVLCRKSPSGFRIGIHPPYGKCNNLFFRHITAGCHEIRLRACAYGESDSWSTIVSCDGLRLSPGLTVIHRPAYPFILLRASGLFLRLLIRPELRGADKTAIPDEEFTVPQPHGRSRSYLVAHPQRILDSYVRCIRTVEDLVYVLFREECPYFRTH